MAPTRSGGRAGRWVLGFSIFAGLGLTLYRNDVLREAAASAGQATNYQKLEAALGGPGFGTPRAVDALVVPASLSDAVRAATAQPTNSSRSAAASSTTPSTTSSEQRSNSSSSTNSQSSPSLSALMAEKLHAPGAAAPERRAPSSAPRAKGEEAPPPKNLRIKGSSNKFDPLNGKL
jgi:hypothetical protein